MVSIRAFLKAVFATNDQPSTALVTPTAAWPQLPRRRLVLFLDFDGVMHRAENGSFERMDVLEGLMAERQDLCIVLSTSWRLNTTPDYLRDFFPRSLQQRIYGVTPDLSDGHPNQRERECLAWAEQNGVGRFIAIDDDASLFSHNCSFLFLTDRYTGLDASAKADLEHVLGSIS